MDSPVVAVPAAPFNFADHLLQRNRERGDKAAFIDDHGVMSYASLADRTRRMAAALLSSGVRREERVVLLMHDCSDWPVAFLGAIYAGVIPVPPSTLLRPNDYAYMLSHSRAKAAIVSAPLFPALQAALKSGPHEVETVIISGAHGASGSGALSSGALSSGASGTDAHPLERLLESEPPLAACAPTNPDDPGFWLYSSGSTGSPKATVHSHANPYWTAQLYGARVLGVREDDVCFSAAKLFFAYGLGNALTFPLSAGATVMLMSERPAPDTVFKRWRGVSGVQPTVFFGAPTGYAAMLASAALPSRHQVALRLASSAGEALPRETGERFASHFHCDLIDEIGSTEMLHIYLSNRPGDVRYGTSGRPVPGYAVELRGEDGRPVADGEIGELYVRGPSAAIMYWRDRARSRDTFQGEWTRTGDKYARSADGYYTYAGRSDDMLKVGGMYVSPFEVEATLMQHTSVLEAAVIGVVDAEGLAKSKAFVVLKPGAHATAMELKSFVKDRLAPYKYPRMIEFVSELPKTATGKIQRFKLRERELRKSAR